MRFFFILLCGLMLTHFPLTAGEHTLSTQISYHSDQNSATGYGLIYQYQLIENFEFEVKYQQSGDLKIISNDKILYGDYSSFSSGINFTKLHHQDLTLKLGLGINLISSSSNNLLVEKDAVAAYFQIAASYQVTNNLSLTFGQSSQFNQNALGTNHSLFFSLNWLFSSGTKSYFKPHTNKGEIQSTSKNTLTTQVIVQPKPDIILQETPGKKRVSTPLWYVQIGAYQDSGNAYQKIRILHDTHSVTFNILLHKEFYRVLSPPFKTKKAAIQHLLHLENSFSIQGFVNKI